MPSTKRELTQREKIALYWHVYTNQRQWRNTFIAASDKSEKELLNYANLDTEVSRWKQRKIVADYYEELKYRFRKEEEEKRDNIIRSFQEEQERKALEAGGLEDQEDGKRGKGKKSQAGPIDYSDPEQQRKKLNQLINEADDDKSALDALKLIISTQKDDREAAKEQKTVRAYLPVTCDICPLYQKAKK